MSEVGWIKDPLICIFPANNHELVFRRAQLSNNKHLRGNINDTSGAGSLTMETLRQLHVHQFEPSKWYYSAYWQTKQFQY